MSHIDSKHLSEVLDLIDSKYLSEALAFLDANPVGFGPRPLTAELLDDNEPDGTIVIRDADGVSRLMMPREVYEDFLKWKP
jgi:hypothetical protein